MKNKIEGNLLVFTLKRTYKFASNSFKIDHKMKLRAKKNDDDDAYYVDNLADEEKLHNSLEGAPPVMQELRRATNEIIVNRARKEGDYVVKVAVANKSPKARIRGYATFYSCIKGSTLPELEEKLGFKKDALKEHGIHLYQIDGSAINTENIAPRGNTDWSGGASPRDLYNLSQELGKDVKYHKDYPKSTSPIIQFVILEEIPCLRKPRRIEPGEVV